jgi:hypothetical protein
MVPSRLKREPDENALSFDSVIPNYTAAEMPNQGNLEVRAKLS